MEHLVAGGRGQRRRTVNARYAFPDEDDVVDDDSDSYNDAFVDENNARGGGARRRSGADGRALADANDASVPRSASQVIEDIKSAVQSSLDASNQRENSLLEGTYKPLLEELLQLGEALQAAGAATDVVAGAAERLIAVEKDCVRRGAAVRAARARYDPSRFVGGGDGGEDGAGGEEGGAGAGGAAPAAAGDAAGAGKATDFDALVDAGRRGATRENENENENENVVVDDDDDDDESGGAVLCAAATSAPADLQSREALEEIAEDDEERLAAIRGVAAPREERHGAPGDGQEGEGVREAGGGDIIEVRGVSGGAAGASGVTAANANDAHNVLLAGARNARCPLTNKRLGDIAEPVEDRQGFVYERAAIEDYVLRETFARVGARRRGGGAAEVPGRGAPASAYPSDVIERARDHGARAPTAGTGHFVALGALRPARRLMREVAAMRAAAARGGGGGGGGGADIEIYG